MSDDQVDEDLTLGRGSAVTGLSQFDPRFARLVLI